MNKIILAADDFEITNFTDEEQVKVQIVNAQLNQSSWFSTEQRSYMIFNGTQCYQRVQYSKTNKAKYRINLRYISDQYIHLKQYATAWFSLSLLFFCSAIGLLFIPALAHQSNSVSAILMLFLSVITLSYAFIQSKNRLIFVSKKGNIPLLEFIYNSPCTDDLDTFIKVLVNKIKVSEEAKPLSNTQYKTHELNELRRLKNEGVISSNTFNKAMLSLMKDDLRRIKEGLKKI